MSKNSIRLKLQYVVLFAVFVCMLLLGSRVYGQQMRTDTGSGIDTTIYTVAEIAPEPFGGTHAYLIQFVKDYRTPAEAIEAKVKGLLEIKFVVERDGRLSRIEVPQHPGYGTAEEAIRLLKEPTWKPGLMNGRPIRVAQRFLFLVDGVNGNIRQVREGESDVVVADEMSETKSAETFADEKAVLANFDTLPEPPGGLVAFMQWVGQRYRFPKAAIDANVNGQLQISFVVGNDGKLTNLKVVKDLGYGTGEEAVRVLKASPRWKPGVLEGKPVRVAYVLPIQLRL